MVTLRNLRETKQGYKIVGTNVHIRKRTGTNNWEIAVYVPERRGYKIISSKTDDLDDAIELGKAKATELAVLKEHGIDPFPRRTSEVIDAFIEWIDGRVKTKNETDHMAKVYKKLAKTHLMIFFGKMGISKINQAVVDKFFVEYMATKDLMSKTSINHMGLTLKKLLTFAQEKGWYKKAVLPKLEIPKHMEIVTRGYFTDAEIEIMLGKIDGWVLENPEHIGRSLIKFMMHFMLATGCRTNDLALLKWRDFTWEDENGNFLNEFNPSPQKLFEASMLSQHTLQTRLYLKVFLQGKRKKRRIGCDVGLAPNYLIWIVASGGNPQPEDCVFSASPPGRKKVFYTPYTETFNEFLEYCKIPKEVEGEKRSPYSFRHTFITRQLKQGVEPFFLAKMCGTSVRELEQTYCHMLSSDLFKKIFKDVPDRQRV